ncbi:MAG TPA: NigD-like C-terminal domain-containing protein, partial [Draconibacterium sp.]|nr:NigD-like C-terminal domain-containing protein [Draconibacterium sp.]
SLLNFKLKYWGYNKTHFLNLVKQPGEITADDQPIQLELRHNANNDPESIPYTAYVSFSLNSLRINELDSVRFEVVAPDYYGGTYQDSGVFNYSNLELPMP